MGINVSRMTAISFGIAAALGGCAGILIAPIAQASATMGLLLGLKGFAVAIIAGITHARGVVIMGLVYGVLEKFVEDFISTAAREAVGFAVIIVLLFAFGFARFLLDYFVKCARFGAGGLGGWI